MPSPHMRPEVGKDHRFKQEVHEYYRKMAPGRDHGKYANFLAMSSQAANEQRTPPLAARDAHSGPQGAFTAEGGQMVELSNGARIYHPVETDQIQRLGAANHNSKIKQLNVEAADEDMRV